jgi:hypothetical protein
MDPSIHGASNIENNNNFFEGPKLCVILWSSGQQIHIFMYFPCLKSKEMRETIETELSGFQVYMAHSWELRKNEAKNKDGDQSHFQIGALIIKHNVENSHPYSKLWHARNISKPRTPFPHVLCISYFLNSNCIYCTFGMLVQTSKQLQKEDLYNIWFGDSSQFHNLVE